MSVTEVQFAESGIRPGYKPTDVGVIPEDWQVFELHEVLASARLGGNYPNSLTQTSRPLIKMGNIGRGEISVDKLEYLPNDIVVESADELLYGDVLLNTRNTLELVGKVGIWRNELPLAYYNSNLLRLKFREDRIGDDFFANSALNANYAVEQLRGFATGTTSVAAIYSRDLNKLKLALPKVPEQRAIAEALGDMNALIAAQQKLIAKKRAIKTATMQRLLTGKQRLPGFGEGCGCKQTEIGMIPDDWALINLGSLSEITKLAGFEYTSYFNGYRDGGEIIVLRGTNITHNVLNLADIRTIPRATSDLLPRSQLRRDDLVFAYVGTIGPVYLVEQDNRFHLGPNTARITCGPELVPKYLKAYFMSEMIESEICRFVSTGAQQSLSMTKIRSFNIALPGVAEQHAIAQTLTDIDAEITALEKRLNKTKDIKQGMMQELLTGRTRLV